MDVCLWFLSVVFRLDQGLIDGRNSPGGVKHTILTSIVNIQMFSLAHGPST